MVDPRGRVGPPGLESDRGDVRGLVSYRGAGKRVIDLALALVGLAVAAPLAIGTAIAVFLAMGRPVFFTQERAGINGTPFRLFKFRTMTLGGDGESPDCSDAARLTRVGRWLRALSLDEIPQLWNVLKGDMSLVGPRPLFMDYVGLYSAEQARRLDVRPGITGWAQVNGRNQVDWDQRFRYDVWYVDHLSFRLDLRILALTVARVLSRDGVAQEGHVTMERFTGSGTRGE